MDARSLADFRAAVHLAGLPRVGRSLALGLLTLLGTLAIVLCARRASGVPLQAPSTALLWACGILLACGALLFRLVVPPAETAAQNKPAAALWLLPSIVLLLWCLGLTFRDSPPLGLIGLWGLALFEEAWSWRQLLSAWPSEAPARAALVHAGSDLAVAPQPAPLAAPDDASDPQATQFLVRRQSAAAGQSIEGWLRVRFEPNQRHAAAHVAICPAFELSPTCYVEQSDGPAATVEVGQALPYGVRFEIRLDRAAPQSLVVTLDFSIHEHPVE